MTFCYVDIETTGLDLMKHDIWEIAYAFDDQPVQSSIVPHSLVGADPEALRITKYHERAVSIMPFATGSLFEVDLIAQMTKKTPTLVGANPAFDAYRLSRRWNWKTPWHYRLIDIEAYAMPILGIQKPLGLQKLADQLGVETTPDHSAHNDCEATRQVFNVLRKLAGLL